MNRRDFLFQQTAVAAVALTPGPGLSQVAKTPVASTPIAKSPNVKAIPKTGETLPIIGLGGSATFGDLVSDGETETLRTLLQTFVDNGGKVFDTAPMYGGGETDRVAGSIVADLQIYDDIFWATKVNALNLFNTARNILGFGKPAADSKAIDKQLEQSFAYYGRETIDAINVHNLADVPGQYGAIQELKQGGRVRYIGATTTFKRQYDDLVSFMQMQSPDLIGIDYAVDNWRDCEERIFPIAQDQGIGVLVYMPFGRTRLWERVEGQALPDWAAEFDAGSWAQFFLKFAASHPAVTVVTPATSKPKHVVDNLGAAYGTLPDADLRKRMIAYVEALPGG